MKITNDERIILNIIKFSPIILVIFVSIFISNIYLTKMEEDFTKEVELTKEKYLIQNKERVKNKIENIYNLIVYEKEKSEQILKQQIKNRVYEAHTIATNIYTGSKSYASKEEISLTIKNVLGNISYNNGRGYFFIDDVKGTGLLQPKNKELENKNKLEFKDAKGYQFVKTIVKTIKEKSERYDTYYWYKPNDNKNTYKKISFYKYFEPLNVAIGTGEYIDDFESDLQKELLLKIKKIKSEDSSYIFIFDDKGTVLSHYKDSLVGTNRYNVKNPLGKYVVKDLIKFAKQNKKGFMSYSTGVNPENLKKRDKISYIGLIEDWNWIIGTGFFLEKFDKEIEQKTKYLLESKQKSINKIIILSIFITLVFILLSFYISNKISKKFITYRSRIDDETKKTIEKERLLIQQSKMAAMGEMIGNIAHQWRQPLSAISTAASGMKVQSEYGVNISNKDIVKFSDHIIKQTEYLSKTIDNFRNFLKGEKLYSNMKIEDLFETILNLTDATISNNRISLILDIEANIMINGSINELSEAFINIINNSKDILKEKVKNEEDRLLFISARKNENQKVEIIFKDSGGGIADNIIDRVFEPYFTSKHQSLGTGLGLSMTDKIIRERHHGSITVQNQEYLYKEKKYKGACFTIIFDLLKS